MPPISDRPSSPFQRYYGTDATLVVLTPRRQSWEPTLITGALLLSAAGLFALTPKLLETACCAAPIYGLLLLLVLGRGRLVALAVEREALMVAQKRFIDADYVTRLRYVDIERVVRGGELGRNSELRIETKVGTTHEISFVGRKNQPRFNVVVNHPGTAFPEDPNDVRGMIMALCNVLIEHGVRIDEEHVPLLPRWRRRLRRRW